MESSTKMCNYRSPRHNRSVWSRKPSRPSSLLDVNSFDIREACHFIQKKNLKTQKMSCSMGDRQVISPKIDIIQPMYTPLTQQPHSYGTADLDERRRQGGELERLSSSENRSLSHQAKKPGELWCETPPRENARQKSGHGPKKNP